MTVSAPRTFGVQLRALREAAGYTQEELAAIAGLSVHGVSALERGERRRPQLETVRALSAALDLTGDVRDAFLQSARGSAGTAPGDDSLPLAPTPLLGREPDVRRLAEWLADPEVRLVTLTGPGGVGKTRLALEVARRIAGDGATRVIFVPLAAIRSPAFVASAIGDALGLSNVTAADLSRRARAAGADRRTLLVLDNFEQVIEVAPLLADLLLSVTALQLLVTSRAPLHLRGEREFAVGPLMLPPDCDRMPADELARIPAVRLFVERVRDVQSGFRLTPENGAVVAAVCRRLDTLPLALELAAPWMKTLTPEELLRRLEQDVLLSTVGPRDLPERQRTVVATVAWSYQLLGPPEQRTFRQLGVLPDRFPIEAAAAVCAGRDGVPRSTDEALGTVAGLIDRSLLLRGDAPASTRPLFVMLETVRAFAGAELRTAGDYDAAMEGLTRYCTAEAELAGAGLIGRAQAEWLGRVQDDLESYRAALTWLIERNRPGDAARIAWPLMFFWLIRGHAPEGQRWYEQILSLRLVPQGAEVRTLIGAAIMLYWQGEHARALDAAARAMGRAEAAADEEMIGQAAHLLGHVEFALGRPDAARVRFLDGARRFRAAAIPWGAGLSLSGLAQVALATGDAVEAERLLDEAAAVLKDEGPWFHALGAYIRAMLALRRGEVDRAIALVRENLARIRDLQDKVAYFYSLVPLAAAAALKGEDAWAARIFGARDAISASTGVNVSDPTILDLHAAAEREARARLGADRWAAAYAVGREASVDALLDDIDRMTRA
ncbi:MAG TPA: helix-turn-helix domain-containing protein [Vicinamibacterales bacterium]|nr:helix-turn-helix domain-containing protein [Vicinamibacterales bacterium]